MKMKGDRAPYRWQFAVCHCLVIHPSLIDVAHDCWRQSVPLYLVYHRTVLTACHTRPIFKRIQHTTFRRTYSRQQNVIITDGAFEVWLKKRLLCQFLPEEQAEFSCAGVWGFGLPVTVALAVLPCPRSVFLNRRAAARYRALTSIIPGRERFSWNW
jgi:hypothetical protein